MPDTLPTVLAGMLAEHALVAENDHTGWECACGELRQHHESHAEHVAAQLAPKIEAAFWAVVRKTVELDRGVTIPPASAYRAAWELSIAAGLRALQEDG